MTFINPLSPFVEGIRDISRYYRDGMYIAEHGFEKFREKMRENEISRNINYFIADYDIEEYDLFDKALDGLEF